MSNTAIWVTVLASSGLVFLLKLAGHLLPDRWFAHPRVAPIVGLVTASLLAGLCAVQTVADGRSLVIDARLVAVVVAAIAFMRKAPFILAIVLAAATAAGLRALGWG
jgi:hypothetical protein